MTRDARLWGLVCVFTLLLGVACGGGGDDEGGPSGPVDLNDSYAVTITNMTSLPILGVDFEMSGDDHTVEVSHLPGMSGVLDLGPRSWTFDDDSSIVVDTDAGTDPLLGEFTLSVTTPLVVPYDAPPTSGALRVDTLSFYAVVTFTATGVDLSVDGGAATSYSLGDFEDLSEDGSASTAEQTSSFAVQVLHFLVERYDAVVDLLEAIQDTSDLEEGFNPRPLTGATWPSGYTLVPDTIDNPGTGSLGWNDRDLSDDVNTGDDLSWGLWEFRPHSDAEWMYDGGMSFRNLVANIDGSGTVVSVGFFDALGREGGVIHDGMRIRQVNVDDGSMTVTEEGMLELAGGFEVQLNPP